MSRLIDKELLAERRRVVAPDVWENFYKGNRARLVLGGYVKYFEGCDFGGGLLGSSYVKLQKVVGNNMAYLPHVEALFGSVEAEFGRTDRRSNITSNVVDFFRNQGIVGRYNLINPDFFRVSNGPSDRQDDKIHTTHIYGTSGILLNPAFEKKAKTPPRLVLLQNEGVNMYAFPFNGSTETRIDWAMRMMVPTFDSGDYPGWSGKDGKYRADMKKVFAGMFSRDVFGNLINGRVEQGMGSLRRGFLEMKNMRKKYIGELCKEIRRLYPGYKGVESLDVIIDTVKLLGLFADIGVLNGICQACLGIDSAFFYRKNTILNVHRDGRNVEAYRYARTSFVPPPSFGEVLYALQNGNGSSLVRR